MRLLDFFLPSAWAHETGEVHLEPVVESVKKLDQLVAENSLQAVYVAAIALGVLLFIAIVVRNRTESAKRVLFWSMAGIIMLTTSLLIAMTVYLNQVSVTKGPVHWHADFEIWACGKKIDLKDPEGWSNKIGTPTLHEHNDSRIHVEGVVVEHGDVTFGSFFQVIGGELTTNSLSVPTNDGQESFVSGTSCPGNEEPAQLQVFAVTADLQNRTYSQHQLVDPASYEFAQESQVPPGDCLIVEFGAPLTRTDKLCQSYQVAKVTGELASEVPYQGDHGN